ncbi:CAP domain-containing protein, partial [Streptococcus thermophilus]|uniref:CAP domain-containing protein n=1 Tax=Streptococcus thermophilus TaxID=1308 RepID=UPI0022FEC7D5
TENPSTVTTPTENVSNGTTVSNSEPATGGTTSVSSSTPGSNENTTVTEIKPENTGSNESNESNESNNTPSVNQTELEKLQETLASQNVNLSDLESKSTAAQSDLDTAKAALDAAQNKDISQYESDVQAQTEKVNTIKANIDTANSSIDTNTQEIQSLNAEIDTLKSNIASADTDNVTAQNQLVSAQSDSDAKTQAYNQIVATISAQYPNINVETDEGLALLETSDANLKASFDAAKSAKDASDLELENATTAVSNVNEANPNLQTSLAENENKVAALNEQINADTANVSTLQSQLTTETATLSELQQKRDDSKNSNVDELQADVNAKQTVVDNVTKEIESVNSQIAETTKTISDIESTVAREDATTSIQALKDLDASEQTDFTNQLNGTETQDVIKAIVAAAQTKDASNKAELDLKAAKSDAVSEINNLKFLSDKQSFTDKVNASDSIDAVASLLTEAKAQDAADQLAKPKVDATDELKALSGLNDSDKASFADKINAATTLDGVSSVVSEAKTVSDLNTYKESAKTTVPNLTKLSDESKAGYTTRIESATSTNDVDAIVAEAKAENQLIPDKESAVSKVKALVNLSDEEQTSFSNDVNNATSKDAVDTVVSEAQAQDQKNVEAKHLDELRVADKAEISAMDHLSDAQKQDFTSKVDAADTQTAVSNLLGEARDTNKLEKAKSEATIEFNNLKYLSADAKSEFTAKVANATSKDTVASIVSDANNADALVKTTEKAKSTIDEFKFLSNDVKSELKTKVEAAKTEADVKSVVDYATKSNKDAKQLQDVQAESIKAINAMTNLTQEQKDAFISKINESNLLSEVKSIRANAVTDNKLAESKAKAVPAIDALTNISDSEKTTFKEKVTAAKAKDEITTIVSDAKTRDALVVSQNDAIAKIKALTYISDNQKAVFGAQIKATTTASAINPISDAAVKAEAAAKELREAKDAALKTAKGYTHVSDEIKTTATTAIEAATSKDDVDKLIANLKAEEDKFHPVLDAKQTTIAQQTLVRLINDYRASYGLPALASDTKLDEASSIRAKEIEQKFAHERPDGSDFDSVLEQVGSTDLYSFGENIAYFSDTNSVDGSKAAQRLFNQWKNSPGHNANMLRTSYNHVSFGVYADKNSVYSSTVFTG